MDTLQVQKKLLVVLGSFIRPYGFSLVAIGLSLVLGTLAVLMGGQSLKHLIAHFHDPKDFLSLFGWLAAIGGLLALAGFQRTYQTHKLAFQSVTHLRQQVTEKSLRLKKTTLDTMRPGYVVHLWQTELELIYKVIGQHLPVFLRSFLQLIGSFIFFIYESPSLALASFVIILALVIPFRYLARRLKFLSQAYHQSHQRWVRFLESIGSYLPMIKALAARDYVMAFYDHHQACNDQAHHRRLLSRAGLIAIVILSFCGALICLMAYGRQDILQGHSSVGDMVAFAYYAVVMGGSLNALAEHFVDIQAGLLGIEKIKNFLILEEERQEGTSITSPLLISFEGVHFAYPQNASSPVLKGITFTWNPETTLGIVGASGTGKSTLIQLLLGFYNVSQGLIKVNGHPMADLDLTLWRKKSMWVSQDPFILPLSLKENLCFGLEAFEDKKLMQALEIVGLKPLIHTWPQGLETPIGQGGNPLSGGERQRLALARAWLADRSLVLLDEPTSALDAATDTWMGETVLPLFKGKSCLIISHRLSTLKGVDCILVLDQGKIVQAGTHKDLMSQQGLYATYAHQQLCLS